MWYVVKFYYCRVWYDGGVVVVVCVLDGVEFGDDGEVVVGVVWFWYGVKLEVVVWGWWRVLLLCFRICGVVYVW